MANVDSPFGLRPIGNTVGGSDFQMTEYLIPDNEGTSIFQGDPVEIDDNNAGFIAVQEAVTNVDNIGVFNGCLIDSDPSTGKPKFSNFYSQTNIEIIVHISSILFEVLDSDLQTHYYH